jgi:hypothetical protein
MSQHRNLKLPIRRLSRNWGGAYCRCSSYLKTVSHRIDRRDAKDEIREMMSEEIEMPKNANRWIKNSAAQVCTVRTVRTMAVAAPTPAPVAASAVPAPAPKPRIHREVNRSFFDGLVREARTKGSHHLL